MASKPAPVPGSRLRQAGWALTLSVAFALFLALTFHVNAIRNQVRLTERQIVAVQQDKQMLETEFQSRASQRQLAEWNAVDFGYKAPRADQFVENETQLAMLGAPRQLDAPQPIRVARAETPQEYSAESRLAQLISPFTDKQLGDEARTIAAHELPRAARAGAAGLAERLAQSQGFTRLAEVRQ